jgi:hypothetical protein
MNARDKQACIILVGAVAWALVFQLVKSSTSSNIIISMLKHSGSYLILADFYVLVVCFLPYYSYEYISANDYEQTYDKYDYVYDIETEPKAKAKIDLLEIKDDNSVIEIEEKTEKEE